MLAQKKKQPSEKARVTIIIPVWNSGQWISDCLAALRRQDYSNFVLLLVDNGSTDGSVERIEKHDFNDFRLLSFPQNMGFAAAVNAGIKQAETPYVVLLNIDTLPAPDWLDCLVKTMDTASGEITSLASKMLNMSDPEIIDSAGDTLNWYGSACKRGHGESSEKLQQQEEVFSACAGAALYRRSLFDEVGFFDERFHSYFEDIDLGFREKLYGYRCLYVPEAVVLHHGHSAGVFGPYYVFLLTRNRLLTLVKNVPLLCLFRHAVRLLYGQFYFFVLYRQPLASFRGYFSAFSLLPGILARRWEIQSQRRTSNDRIDKMISSKLGEPGIVERILRKVVCW